MTVAIAVRSSSVAAFVEVYVVAAPASALASRGDRLAGDAPRRPRRTTLCIVKPADPRRPTWQAHCTEVTDTNFQAEVIESDSRCSSTSGRPGAVRAASSRPVLEEIAAERHDLRIVKLNIDENQQTAADFEVLSIPTMILFKGGQLAKKVIGAYPKKKLEAELEPALA